MPESKWTAKRRAGIVQSIAAGCSVPDAARANDCGAGTVKEWISRGRRGDSPEHVEFVRRVDEARATAHERSSVLMDREELLRCASESARRGSVQAMKLVHVILTARGDNPEPSDPDDPLKALDELAARRVAAQKGVANDN